MLNLNQTLNPEALDAVADAVAMLRDVTAGLAASETGVAESRAVPAIMDEAISRTALFQAALAPVLEGARSALGEGPHAVQQASEKLLSAHAMTMAHLISLDMAAVSAGFDSLTASSPPPAGGALQAVASPPPGALQTLFNKLGKIGAWLWSIIQTLLTPKGWSIEGGVGFPGLANAKLTVTFGT